MVSGSVGRPLRQGMSGWTFPVGLCTLLVNHRGISQPSHHVLRACLPLMGPLRGMLLTANQWLLLLSLKGSPGTCMPGVCCHSYLPLSRRTRFLSQPHMRHSSVLVRQPKRGGNVTPTILPNSCCWLHMRLSSSATKCSGRPKSWSACSKVSAACYA